MTLEDASGTHARQENLSQPLAALQPGAGEDMQVVVFVFEESGIFSRLDREGEAFWDFAALLEAAECVEVRQRAQEHLVLDL
jgi:hypothetical protein